MKARRWRRGALLGLVLVVALIAAGCGDDSGGGTATAAAAPVVDEALAAKVPDAIKADGKLLIGVAFAARSSLVGCPELYDRGLPWIVAHPGPPYFAWSAVGLRHHFE